MKYISIICCLVFFIPLIIVISSCTGTARSIEDAIASNIVQDDFTILRTVDVNEGYITFFERVTLEDIGIAFVNKSKSKSKTMYRGYLSENDEHSNWHYSSAELGGEAYSIYYGRLNEQPNEKVFIKLGDQQEEATLVAVDSIILWFVVINKRVEVNEISILLGDH